MLRSLLCAALFLLPFQAVAAAERPNFLIIVADDLGFSDLGAFGGEIETPNLDALALRGVRLTGFHTAPTCSPTRAMLLTGTDNHLAGLGTMAEIIRPNQAGKPGYEGYLRPDVPTLAERLAAGGYRTLLSGKWHLGLSPEQDPSRRGFQQSFTMLQGAHNHFGAGLSEDPRRGTTYRENGQTLKTLPAGFYSSDAFASKLIEQLEAGRKGEGADKPFFAYLAFTAPHFPLHAPPELVAKYKGRYDAGYEALRAARLKRQAELGLVDPGKAAHPLVGARWDSLSADQKAQAAREMEVYAAMVDSIDGNIGRILAALRASGELDNTVILFLADNGAEGVDLTVTPNASLHDRWAKGDNRLENLGAATSYVGYGPGWAQAATAPSRLYKAVPTEGGTRVVAFLGGKPVGKLLGKSGHIEPAFTSVMDVTPTFLELAGLAPAGAPVRGRSWAPLLSGKASRVYPEDQPVGVQLFSGRGLRQGDWKLTDIGDGRFGLFNLARDPGETEDQSAREPARKAALVEAYEAYAREVGVVMPDPPFTHH